MTERPSKSSSRNSAAPAAFVGLFIIYLATASFDQRQSIDALSTLAPAWHLASFGNVYTDSYQGFTPWFVQVNEHVISNRLPGAILWATPFYAVLGRGGDYAPVYPAAVAAATACCLAAFFIYRALLQIVSRSVALAAAIVLGLATPTWSVSSGALWTHGPAQLFLAAGLLAYAQQREVLGGLAHAAAILTRPHLAVVALVMGAAAARQRRSWRLLISVGAASSLGVLGLLIYYRLVYGQWTLTGGYGSMGGYGVAPGLAAPSERLDGSSPFFANVLAALFSPGRGLLIYSPYLLLLLPGVVSAWARSPGWVRSSTVAAVLYSAVQLWNNGYSGENFFAYRFLLEPLTLAVPFLTLCYVSWTRRHTLAAAGFWVLVGISVAFEGAASLSHLEYPGRLDLWHSFQHDDVAREQPVVLAVLLVLTLGGAATAAVRSHRHPATSGVVGT